MEKSESRMQHVHEIRDGFETATRSSKFWYSDGSVVILAKCTIFKVHLTLLSQSPIFAAVLQSSLCHRARGTRTMFDGCPCLRLEDDPKDLDILFSAIYQPLYFDSLPPGGSLGTILDAVSGLFRVSYKYEMGHFALKCTDILDRSIGVSLADYDVFPNPFTFRDLVAAIILAETVNITSVLPRLYYAMTGFYPIDCEELTWKTKAICMAAGFQLFSLFRTKTHPFLFDFVPSPHCESGCYYHTGMEDFRAAHKAYLHAGVLRPLEDEDLIRMDICLTCEEMVYAQNAVGRATVFASLPRLFGLDAPLANRSSNVEDAILVDATHPQPHPEFWYSDGSVVLVVGSFMFRIHRSRLIANSEVFAGMFDLPTSEFQDLIHGCPSVVLYDDPNDFVLLLRALDTPMFFEDFPPTSALSHLMSIIPGILRLSTKYNISTLRKKCIKLLACKFATTLAEYDTTSGQVYEHEDVIAASNLAEQLNIPEILPHAFSIIADRAVTYSVSAVSQLSWRTRSICMAGRQKSMYAFYDTTHPFLFKFEKAPYCLENCRFRTRPQDMEKLWGDRMSDLLAKMHDLEWNAMNLCPRCRAFLQKQHKHGREQMWDQLPMLFGLGSWANIRATQALN